MNDSIVRSRKYNSPAILNMKIILINTSIATGKNFGLRSVAQVHTSCKDRVADASAVGDGTEQLLPTTW